MSLHRTDFATLKRPRSPNTFLMAPEGFCKEAKVDLAPPVYAVEAAKLRQAFLGAVIAQPRVSHSLADEPGLYDDFVVRSALFRFPDLVSVQFIAGKGKTSTLALYSRSVYGRSDLGVNRRRSLAWLALMDVAKAK
ncbi:MAG: DUF1499 domain-containing protein [Alphaproteobacteria bacterium]|nr:DUF1499 domain-containing protein [Alphaproteobacteria bacterium]